MEMNYGTDYSISEKGMTTRTISGYLLIVNGHVADSLRSFLPTVLKGFKRKLLWMSIDEPKHLDFKIIDIETTALNHTGNDSV